MGQQGLQVWACRILYLGVGSRQECPSVSRQVDGLPKLSSFLVVVVGQRRLLPHVQSRRRNCGSGNVGRVFCSPLVANPRPRSRTSFATASPIDLGLTPFGSKAQPVRLPLHKTGEPFVIIFRNRLLLLDELAMPFSFEVA